MPAAGKMKFLDWCIENAKHCGCRVSQNRSGIVGIRILDYEFIFYEDLLKSKEYKHKLFLLAIQWINETHKKFTIDISGRDEEDTEDCITVTLCDILFAECRSLREALEYVWAYPKYPG